MAFAFNPDDRPARIFRYVERGTLPDRNLLSLYDAAANLLIIDKFLFDQLTATEKHLVLRTQEMSLSVRRHTNQTLSLAA